MKTGTTIILIGGAIAAYLLFAPKNNADGGSGGSLGIPASVLGDLGATGTTANPDNSFQISDTILAAMANTSKKAASNVTLTGNEYGGLHTNVAGYVETPTGVHTGQRLYTNVAGWVETATGVHTGQNVNTKKVSAPALATGANSGSIGWRSSNVSRGGKAGGWGV